jgi:hypothetical protein
LKFPSPLLILFAAKAPYAGGLLGNYPPKDLIDAVDFCENTPPPVVSDAAN